MTKYLYLDSNVFLQCKPLKELPWADVCEDDDIALVVARTVQRELDQNKRSGNPRRAKRARAATTIFRDVIAAPSERLAIVGPSPNVYLTFAAPCQIEWERLSFLDSQDPDDRIIA